MVAIKRNGWLIAAVVSVVLACIVVSFLQDTPGGIAPIITLIVSARVLWNQEKHRKNSQTEKKIIVMSACILMLFVMKAALVEAFMQSHLGISGYGAFFLFVAPIFVWFVWADIKKKSAEEEAKQTAEGKGAE